jgi:hypothetical protein
MNNHYTSGQSKGERESYTHTHTHTSYGLGLCLKDAAAAAATDAWEGGGGSGGGGASCPTMSDLRYFWSLDSAWRYVTVRSSSAMSSTMPCRVCVCRERSQDQCVPS